MCCFLLFFFGGVGGGGGGCESQGVSVYDFYVSLSTRHRERVLLIVATCFMSQRHSSVCKGEERDKERDQKRKRKQVWQGDTCVPLCV